MLVEERMNWDMLPLISLFVPIFLFVVFLALWCLEKIEIAMEENDIDCVVRMALIIAIGLISMAMWTATLVSVIEELWWE